MHWEYVEGMWTHTEYDSDRVENNIINVKSFEQWICVILKLQRIIFLKTQEMLQALQMFESA